MEETVQPYVIVLTNGTKDLVDPNDPEFEKNKFSGRRVIVKYVAHPDQLTITPNLLVATDFSGLENYLCRPGIKCVLWAYEPNEQRKWICHPSIRSVVSIIALGDLLPSSPTKKASVQ